MNWIKEKKNKNIKNTPNKNITKAVNPNQQGFSYIYRSSQNRRNN